MAKRPSSAVAELGRRERAVAEARAGHAEARAHADTVKLALGELQERRKAAFAAGDDAAADRLRDELEALRVRVEHADARAAGLEQRARTAEAAVLAIYES